MSFCAFPSYPDVPGHTLPGIPQDQGRDFLTVDLQERIAGGKRLGNDPVSTHPPRPRKWVFCSKSKKWKHTLCQSRQFMLKATALWHFTVKQGNIFTHDHNLFTIFSFGPRGWLPCGNCSSNCAQKCSRTKTTTARAKTIQPVSQASYLTYAFTTLELHNLSYYISELHKICRTSDLEALNFWKGRSSIAMEEDVFLGK